MLSFSDFCVRIAHALHSGVDHVDFSNGKVHIRTYPASGVRYAVVQTLDRGSLTFLQQNPHPRGRDSVTAGLSRKGHEITWITKRTPSGAFSYEPDGIVDGKYTPNVHETCREIEESQPC